MKQCPKCAGEGVGPKPLSDFCKDRKTKSGLSVYCKYHRVEYARKKRALDPEKYLAKQREANKKWLKLHPERAKELRNKANREWRLRNPELVKKIAREKRLANPELYSALDKRKRLRKPELYANIRRANKGKRRAAELCRAPLWADVDKIRLIYANARIMTEMLGEPWHVDHIIPLQGKFVSGLHVPENLQILPGVENIRKSNRFDLDNQRDSRDLRANEAAY